MSVERGTAALLTRRREILAQGAEPIGWKIGFNVRETQERLGIDAPLAGFLTTDSLVEDDWDEYPVIVESEVALEIGDDGRSIAALFPALEIADPPDLDLGRSSRSWPATSSTVRSRSALVWRPRSPAPRASS